LTKRLYQRKGLGLRIQKKAAAQLVFKGAVPSYSSCAFYMNSWTKEANDNDLKTTFIQGKNKAKGRLWKLIIVAEEPEDITAVDDEMYKELYVQLRKADALAFVRKKKVCRNF
jgi:hypothetical protein